MARKKASKKTSKKVSRSKTVKASDPEDGASSVKTLSEMDRMRFGKLDAEMRNHLQGMRIADLELASAERELRDRITALTGHREQLKALIAQARPVYDEFLAEIAEKHGISDPKHLLIDSMTGTVRDTKTDL